MFGRVHALAGQGPADALAVREGVITAIGSAAIAFEQLRGSIRVFGYASEAWWQAGLSGWTPPDHTDPAHANPACRLKLVGVKIYSDGALCSSGAALLEGNKNFKRLAPPISTVATV